jgi:hypothetical protein
MPLFRMMDDMDIGPEERRQLLGDIQYCESIALKVTHDNEPG